MQGLFLYLSHFI